MNLLKKATLGIALGASTLVAAAPAEAQYRYDRHRHRGDNDAALAIGAGVLGLAVGAAIASNSRRDRYDDYYDRGYYPRQRGYYGYNNYDGYDRHDGYNSYRYDRPRYRERCWIDRAYDDYRGRWVRVRRCG